MVLAEPRHIRSGPARILIKGDLVATAKGAEVSVFTPRGNADRWLHRQSGYRSPGRLRCHSLLLLGQPAGDIGANHVRFNVTAYLKQVSCILHEVDRGHVLRGAGQQAPPASISRVLDEPRSISRSEEHTSELQS